MAIRERNLQKWEPSELEPDMSLESTGSSTEWDQFSTNERLFGIQSNYDENLYTTTCSSQPTIRYREGIREANSRAKPGIVVPELGPRSDRSECHRLLLKEDSQVDGSVPEHERKPSGSCRQRSDSYQHLPEQLHGDEQRCCYPPARIPFQPQLQAECVLHSE
jgi:hypothetical protein